VIRLKNPELDTRIPRPSSSIPNTDRECNSADSVCHIAFSTPYKLGVRRLAALPAEEEKQLPVRSNLQGKEVGDILYLIEPRPRNPWAAMGSLAFLSVLLLALIVIPLFRTDPLPKRETVTMLYLQPPSVAGSNATKLQSPKLASTYIPTSTGITMPVRKTQEAPPPPVDTTSGVVGGVPGGVIGRVPGGILSEVLGNTRSVPVLAKTPEPTKRMRIASRVAAANLIHDVAPIYPPEAGRARIEGTVVLLAVIGKDGTVQDVRVESGKPVLAHSAMDAVKQWRYRPYLLNGEPVEIDSQITINFNLSRG
jgi:protein TonB